LSAGSPPLEAQCLPAEQQLLLAGDGGDSDLFGSATAIEADFAVVGAPGFNAAYIFQVVDGRWVQQQKLQSGVSFFPEDFGTSVSLHGDVIVVGAPSFGADDPKIGIGPGGAYVFRYNGIQWVQEAILATVDGEDGDNFGGSVSVRDDVCIVGARGDNSSEGSARIYRFQNGRWVEETILTPPTRDELLFGRSVSVGDDVAVVGAPTGSVHIFRYSAMRSQWEFEQTVFSPDGGIGDQFGFSVSVSDDVFVVGAPFHDNFPPISGSAYIFRFNGGIWEFESELRASNAGFSDFFGESVDMDGAFAIVGARVNDQLGFAAGSANVFRLENQGWNEVALLHPTDAANGDQFGVAVAISGTTALVGAHLNDDLGEDSGSAYVFDVDFSTGDLNCDGLVDGHDLGTLLLAWGECGAGSCPADLSGDGQVEGDDLGILLVNWG
jgi:hypothetical protein